MILNIMGFETNYVYIYYTVLDMQDILELLREVGTIDEMLDTLTMSERERLWIDSLNKSFRYSNDDTVNNFRVDEARYCDDIKQWYHLNMQHYKCPVFVQYNYIQSVKIDGEGHMFYLYEKEDDDISVDQSVASLPSRRVRQGTSNYQIINGPDTIDLDLLASSGGRL